MTVPLILILAIWKSCRNWKFSFSGKRKSGCWFLLGPVAVIERLAIYRGVWYPGFYEECDFDTRIYKTIIMNVYWLKKTKWYWKTCRQRKTNCCFFPFCHWERQGNRLNFQCFCVHYCLENLDRSFIFWFYSVFIQFSNVYFSSVNCVVM